MAEQWIPDNKMFQTGLNSLEWLIAIQTDDTGHLSIIDNENCLIRNGTSSKFDQQPIEAMGLIDACAEAYKAIGDSKWLFKAERCLG